MVTFDGYPLQNVLGVSTQDSEVITEQAIPWGSLPYRSARMPAGKVITVSGKIRSALYALLIEGLRVRINDVAGFLNLEDGTGVINAKLGGLDVTWAVEDGLERPTYAATFYETF